MSFIRKALFLKWPQQLCKNLIEKWQNCGILFWWFSPSMPPASLWLAAPLGLVAALQHCTCRLGSSRGGCEEATVMHLIYLQASPYLFWRAHMSFQLEVTVGCRCHCGNDPHRLSRPGKIMTFVWLDFMRTIQWKHLHLQFHFVEILVNCRLADLVIRTSRLYTTILFVTLRSPWNS